jgi:hypothetical protein
MERIIENTSYQMVCMMIDAGIVESVPEGLDLESTISTILKKNLPQYLMVGKG